MYSINLPALINSNMTTLIKKQHPEVIKYVRKYIDRNQVGNKHTEKRDMGMGSFGHN